MMRFSTGLKLAALSVALVLAGCESKPKDVPESAAPAATGGVTQSSIVPGSAEDLRVNVGDTVHFAYNEYNIEDADKALLGRQAAWL